MFLLNLEKLDLPKKLDSQKERKNHTARKKTVTYGTYQQIFNF